MKDKLVPSLDLIESSFFEKDLETAKNASILSASLKESDNKNEKEYTYNIPETAEHVYLFCDQKNQALALSLIKYLTDNDISVWFNDQPTKSYAEMLNMGLQNSYAVFILASEFVPKV